MVSNADGVHVTSPTLLQMEHNDFAEKKWLAASIHDVVQLNAAHKIGVDFVVASPVLATSSHPEARPLGWDALRTITEQAQCPVYALGGMQVADIGTAWQYGAQGIAAISALWGHDESQG